MSWDHDPFGRSSLPPAFDREARVRLLAEAAEALLAGRLPDPAARLFLAGALQSWLRDGGRLGALERDHLRVAAPHRSTMTAARLYARCSNGRATGDSDADNMGPSETGEPNDEPGEP